MKFFTLSLAAAAVLGTLSARADVVYNSQNGTINAQNTFHYMELATVGVPGSIYNLDSVDVAVEWTSIARSQDIYVFIYSGATAGDPTVFDNPVLGIGKFRATPTALGEQDVYSLSLVGTNGTSLTVSGTDQLAFEFVLGDIEPAPQFTGATGIRGVFGANSAAVPGLNTTASVFSNGDNNTDFSAANITKFGNATENAYFVVNATPVPEPSALVFSAVAGCVLLGSVMRFRGTRKVA